MAFRTASPILQSDVAKVSQASVSVGVSSAQLVGRNTGRSDVTISNDHATAKVYLSLGGTAVVGSGIRVNPAGGTYTTSAYSGVINAISDTAATNVTVTEV